jgi:hypothetical protein
MLNNGVNNSVTDPDPQGSMHMNGRLYPDPHSQCGSGSRKSKGMDR